MHTPFTIEQAFTNALRKLTEVETLIEITGFYYMKGEILYSINYRNSKEKFYFDEIRDTEGTFKTTILVSEAKRALLTDGRKCHLRCLAHFRADRNCSVQIVLIVEEIVQVELVVDLAKNADSLRKSEIIKIFRAEKRQQNTSLLLKTLLKKNQTPAVALVQPKQNDTRNDILEALGEHADKYIFTDFKVNIRSEHEIIKILKETDSERKFNLIALFRGGGETNDFNVFDSISIAECIINMHTPFVMAVGHAGDEPFAQRVCDRAFSTPGDFGSYLKEMYVNSGREDNLSFAENDLMKFQSKLNLERHNLNQEKEQLFENIENLKIESALINKKRAEFIAVKEENIQLKQQISLIKPENKFLWRAIPASILVALLLVAATYVLTTYFLSFREAGGSADMNSNSRTPSNVSNAKSK